MDKILCVGRGHHAMPVFAMSSFAVVLLVACTPLGASSLLCPAPPLVRDGLISPMPVATSKAAPSGVGKGYGNLPLQFERNVGQTDPRVKFLSRSGGGMLCLTGDEAVLRLTRTAVESRRFDPKHPDMNRSPDLEKRTVSELRMRAVGANASARVDSLDELPGKVNYFIGSDPAKWHANIPTYKRVAYRDLYKDVDLVYYGNGQSLEYDFVVRPGGDPSKIAVVISGAKSMRVASSGDLVLTLPGGGNILWRKPAIYQADAAGHRTAVLGGYVLAAGGAVRFALGRYDARRPLVIDPTLVYCTYFSPGAFGWVYGRAIAVDNSGCAYITGYGVAGAIGKPNTLIGSLKGSNCVFVAKLNAAGTGIEYSTYVGGSAADYGFGISVDAAGCPYVTGYTGSSDFPVTAGAFQSNLNCQFSYEYNAFVFKLTAAGSALAYSTYLGGKVIDAGWGIVVDPLGSAYVVGTTSSSNFPTTSGAFQRTYGGTFITKLNSGGTGLVYSTYLGNGYDSAQAVALDSMGNIYVTGSTKNANFPVTSGAFQKVLAGAQNAFVAKLNAAGSALVYATYLGGSGKTVNGTFYGDIGYGIAVDESGNSYVTGRTGSSNFPVTHGSFQTSPGTAFVTKLNQAGSGLVYSTYLGESSIGYAIAADSTGCASVTGWTNSATFPVSSGAIEATFPNSPYGSSFVTRFNATGSALTYSTYLGGSEPVKDALGVSDTGYGIAVDRSGNAYAAGVAVTSGYPVTAGAAQQTITASPSAFVAKFDLATGTFVLWCNPNSGLVSVWNVAQDRSSYTYNVYGPWADWQAIAISAGSAGHAFVLWDHPVDHMFSLWNVAPDWSYTYGTYGPYAGWSAIGLGGNSIGNANILWACASTHMASLWTVKPDWSITCTQYGPYGGWQAIKVSSESTGIADILWDRAADHTASLWRVAADSSITNSSYGPYASWQATALSAGPSGTDYLLWTYPSTQQTSLWNVASDWSFTSKGYGPWSGWSAIGLGTTGDGNASLVWDKASDHTMSLWAVAPDTSYTNTLFGPFSGWQAVGVAGAN